MTQEEYSAAFQKGFAMTQKFLISKGLSSVEAEEYAQRAWTKGWEKLAQLRNPEMVVTWVNRIAVNNYLSERRKIVWVYDLSNLTCEPRVSHETDIVKYLDPLHPKMRQIVMLRIFEEMEFKEIANHLGVTERQVHSRLCRAFKIVRDKFAVTIPEGHRVRY